MGGENKMQNNEDFFKEIFAGFINSEENKRAWFIDEGIKAYFKNNSVLCSKITQFNFIKKTK